MIILLNADVEEFLNNNKYGVTQKDLETDRLEVLEIMVFFKITKLMEGIEQKNENFMSSQTYLGLFNQLQNTRNNLNYHVEFIRS